MRETAEKRVKTSEKGRDKRNKKKEILEEIKEVGQNEKEKQKGKEMEVNIEKIHLSSSLSYQCFILLFMDSTSCQDR